jgi:IclR helix-turn-helix domain
MARQDSKSALTEPGVEIALTHDQIDFVLRAATREPKGTSESLLIAALDHAHSPDGNGNGSESFRDATKRALQAALDDPQLSQSLLRGLALLSCYTPQREWRTISDLAKELDLPPSTAHRYARTLRAIGLLEQHPGTREYRPATVG